MSNATPVFGRPVFDKQDVELESKERSYNGFFKIDTLRFKHRLFEGGWSETVSRELFERGDAVGILLHDPDRRKVALVEQFRIGPFARGDQPWMLELVAGMIDKDETPEQVGIREANEEAGAVVESLEFIADYYSSPGGSSERLTLFCGKTNLSQVGGIHGLPEEAEDIKVHVVDIDDAFKMLEQGRFANAHTIIAMQWLKLYGGF